MQTAFVYSDQYFAYDYGESHPLKIERLRLTHQLCRGFGLLDLPGVKQVQTRVASETEVLRFHTAGYIQTLQQASLGKIHWHVEHGLGMGDNPVFPGVWEWSLLHTGASIQCAELVAQGKVRIAFNIAGGLHHAAPDRASGFCYINDPVIAIYHLLDHGMRVLYLDIDAHHGDGVQWAFYEDPRVLTISFHQDGRTLFPGSGDLSETGRGAGTGYAVNVPMLPGTDDHVFWDGFERLVPPLLDSFKPDVVVSQLGVDTFVTDPLATLRFTTNGFSKVIVFLAKHAPAWVALGGGGYDISNVVRAWTLAWSLMNGVDLPDEIPMVLKPLLAAQGLKMEKLRDPEHASPWRETCQVYMDECLDFLLKTVLPRVVRT